MICKNCGSSTITVATVNKKVGNQQVKASCKCMACGNQWFEIQGMKVKCIGHKPSYANEFAAGLDIRSNNYLTIYPNNLRNKIYNLIQRTFNLRKERPTTVDISTRLAMEIPKGYFGMVAARSGLAFKYQIKLINDVGIIDEDYRGYIGIRLINEGTKPYTIKAGDRVAQMIIAPYIQPELIYVDELEDTERGERGFGHSGR